MPYVPGIKTTPPAGDRSILDPHIERLAELAAGKITENHDLIRIYESAFLSVADILVNLLREKGHTSLASDAEVDLAKAIYTVSAKYDYWGAFLGEFNYVWTRFIQRVPQIKVALGHWKVSDELRYWLDCCTVEALTYAATRTLSWGIGLSGAFEDIKDEFKIKVNQAYEMAQARKNGECYDTPWYMRQVPITDEQTGENIGYVYVAVKRSPETINEAVLQGHLVFKRTT